MFLNYQSETKSLIKKVFLFFLPIILIFLFFDFFAVYSGELWPLDKAVKYQKDSNVLFGRKSADMEYRPYKYKTILANKPDILAIGSSRIMQMRKEMFSDKYKFYNAGGIAFNVGDIVNLINVLPADYAPKVIILGADFTWFGNKREITSGITDGLKKTEEAYNWKAHLYASRFLFFEFLKDPGIISKILKRGNPFDNRISLGFSGLNGNGFRNDGSYQYAVYINELREENKYIDRDSFIDRAISGATPLQFDSKFDEERFNLLKYFLQKCKEKNIKVVGINLPFSWELYEELMNSPRQKDLFGAFQKRVPELFKNYNFAFYDAADAKSIGLNDLYMFDGMHATETAVATVLLKIPELSGVLAPDLELKLNDAKTTSFEINWQ